MLTMVSLSTFLPAAAQTADCPMVKIEARRLPDMNVPRAGHATFCVDGELVVMGGHTSGFVPTATAEYFSDGQWHVVPMVYEHDNGLSVLLSSGKVLIGGGHEQHLGIGQTFPVEMYDPATHTFEGFGCLDCKRSLASATEIDSGRVVIAGNWYADDAIELFDGDQTFTLVKKLEEARPYPYVLRTAPDNAIVFGSVSRKSQSMPSDTVVPLKGESYSDSLLKMWRPVAIDVGRQTSECLIGDTAKGDYSYLIFAGNDNGEKAFIKVSGTGFSLLPTACSVPLTGVEGDSLYLYGSVHVDRRVGRAYVVGQSNSYRAYVVCVDYAKAAADLPAPLTVYYTAPLDDFGGTTPIMTPQGDIVVAGGINDSNYSPFSSVWLLHVGTEAVEDKGTTPWWWLLPVGAVAAAVAVIWLLHRRRSAVSPSAEENDDMEEKAVVESPFDEEPSDDDTAEDELSDEDIPDDVPPSISGLPLRERIEKLMIEERLYLDPHLKLTDLVRRVYSNRNYVYQTINVEMGMSFTEYVNRLRVDHAERLLAEHPELSMSEVAAQSGFASKVSFHRNFKAYRGRTPKKKG